MSKYKLDSVSEHLLTTENECTFCWTTAAGHPCATIVSFVYSNAAVWMTALAGSARVNAIQRRPATTVVISGKGSGSAGRCTSLQGHSEIVDGKAERDWFFSAFAQAVLPNSKTGAQMMANSMNSPENCLLKFVSARAFPYDAARLMADADTQ